MDAMPEEFMKETCANGAKNIHFLHIGKAAGSQVRYLTSILNDSQTDWHFIKHRHRVSLRDLPRKAPFFFSIRRPHTRFVSGFYSRKRKGQPRLFVDWKPNEKMAFKRFEHANDLAEALFADGQRGHDAFDAINAMNHTAKGLRAWFEKRGFFLDRRPPLGIIRQEHLDADWARLMTRLEIENPPAPTQDKTRAHRNDYADTPSLSDQARANLTRWYVQDIAFYDRCTAWIDAQD